MVDCTTREDQDEIWGRVIDAVDDDSMWAGNNNFDDFSVSVYKKSSCTGNPIAPTTVQKKALPITRRSIDGTNTPISPRPTMISQQIVKTSGSTGKTLKKDVFSMEIKSAPIQPPNMLLPELSQSSQDDWTVPLEITTNNDRQTAISQNSKRTSNTSPFDAEEAFNKSFADVGALLSDDKAKNDLDDGFSGVLSHKFNKSLGDLPTKDLEDLMQSPLDFLKSKAKETKAKSGSTRKARSTDVSGEKERDAKVPQSINVENNSPKKEKRSITSSEKKNEKSPSKSGTRRSRSADNKKEKMRKDRSRSRGAVRKDSGKEKSSRGGRTIGKAKSSEKSKRESRTADAASKKDGEKFRRARSVGRSSSTSPKSTDRSGSKSLREEGQSTRDKSLRRSRSRSSSSQRKNRTSSRSLRKDDRKDESNKDQPRRRPRSRSSGPTSLGCSLEERKKDRSGRRERSIGRIRLNSKPPDRSVSPSKMGNRRRRASDKRITPQRAKSDDLMDLLGASLGDLGKLGISFEPLLISDTEISGKNKSFANRKRLSRTKSMIAAPMSHDLRNGLSRVDEKSGKVFGRKSDEVKSMGGASTGTSSTKRSSGSSRGTVVSDAEQAERLLKEQAKLVREQRKAEEAKLKRLQEESRLLEEKTRSEEMRLMALKEETKLLEVKRLEEEARARVEAKVAQEQRNMEECRQKQAEDERSADSQDPLLSSLFDTSSKGDITVTSTPSKDEVSSISVDSKEDSNGTSVRQPPRRSSSYSFSQSHNKKKFGGSLENAQHLPPAFQLLHEQSKRVERNSTNG